MNKQTIERWLPIPGHAGRYEVSDIGRVRSYLRPGGRGFLHSQPAMLRHCPNSYGYLTVNLMESGRVVKKMVHRLVALAFLPDDCKPGYEVNHKDSNPGNPHLSNLEWVSKSGNCIHAVKHGRGPKPKLTEEQREEVRQLCIAGTLHADIRARFKISARYVARLSREAKTQSAAVAYIQSLRAEGPVSTG